MTSFRENKKQSYLSYRMSGFSRKESARFAKVTDRTVRNWLAADPEFRATDERDLLDLHRGHGKDSLAMDFTRNMLLVLGLDHQLITKAAQIPDELTKAERKALITMRATYTVAQLQALDP